MGYTEHLQKTIDFIEENIRQSLTAEQCAEVAGFSRHHFHRLLMVYMRLPVMAYVRKRKLSHARSEISKGARVIEVAIDFGYGSERSFSRAFVQEFRTTPGRVKGIPYTIPRKPVIANYRLRTDGGVNMYSEVRFEKLDSMVVASLYVISHDPETEVIDRMEKWAHDNGIDSSARCFGFDIPVSEEERSQGKRGYEYWVVVPENTRSSEDILIKKIESCKYAVLRITDPMADPFNRIPQGWKKLVNWVTEHCEDVKHRDDRYCLEEEFEEDGVNYMDLFLPLA